MNEGEREEEKSRTEERDKDIRDKSILGGREGKNEGETE